MSAESVLVELNGESRELGAGTSVDQMLRLIDAPTKGVAVACNGSILPRSEWSTTFVRAGDQLEVLTVAAGG